jgi:hypothetical protein
LLSKIESQSRLSGYASIEWVAPKRFPVLDSSSRHRTLARPAPRGEPFKLTANCRSLSNARCAFSCAAVNVSGAASRNAQRGLRSPFARAVSFARLQSGAPRADTEPPSGIQNFKDLGGRFGPFEASPLPGKRGLEYRLPGGADFPDSGYAARWEGILFRCLNRQKDSTLPNLPDFCSRVAYVADAGEPRDSLNSRPLLSPQPLSSSSVIANRCASRKPRFVAPAGRKHRQFAKRPNSLRANGYWIHSTMRFTLSSQTL